jgi:hypothetical protein
VTIAGLPLESKDLIPRLEEMAGGEPVVVAIAVETGPLFKIGRFALLDAARTDGSPGSLTAEMRYLARTEQPTTALRLDDYGFLARLLEFPALSAVALELSGGGCLDGISN